MIIIQIINIIAIIVIPVIAVYIAHKLQIKAEKRKDKMSIFKTLMTSRIYGWTPASVDALNIIDIVFADDDEVRNAWSDLNDKYHVTDSDEQHLKKIETAQYKLLETIANSLGYKDKITWETIQNPYMPDGMVRQMEEQKRQQQLYYGVLDGVQKMIPRTDITIEEKPTAK